MTFLFKFNSLFCFGSNFLNKAGFTRRKSAQTSAPKTAPTRPFLINKNKFYTKKFEQAQFLAQMSAVILPM
jgi:hypothetical protein